MSDTATRAMAVTLPIFLSGVGLAVSIVCIFIARALRQNSPAMVLRAALIVPSILLPIVSFVIMPMLNVSQAVTWAITAGAIGGAVIGLITEFYTAWSPVERVAESSKTGAGTGVISGLAVGMESTVVSLFIVAVVGFGSLLSRNSALFTAPNLRDFRVVRVHGYRRVFAHTSPIFFERNIANAETREIASLSVEEAKEHSFIGCRFEIPLKEYPALAVREAEFNFTGVETRDISTNEVVGESLSVCCVRGSDEIYTRKYCTKVLEGDENCECVKCKLKTFGEPMIWTDELILPTRTYCRHCVLAARGLGKVIEDDFLDNTFLADRKTRLREHLEKDPSILEELPPESLAVRYGG